MAKPKLALIPAAQGTKLYSVLPSDGSGDFTFTRGSVATRINAQGLIENVASGQSRLDYPLIDGVQKGCPHHILEPTRTNLLSYSSELNIGTSGTASVSSNTTISPDGALNADTLGVGYLSKSVSAAANTYTLSVFVKVEVSSTASIYIYDGTYYSGTYDLTTGISTGVGTSMVNYGNGWWRCIITQAIASTISEIGFNSGQVYGYGLQLEQGSYATSYIPTSGNAVTRVAETANGAGNSTTFNSEQGVLMVETKGENDATFNYISIGDGGTSNYAGILYTDNDNEITYRYYVGGSGVQIILNGINVTNFNKIAVKWKENDFAIWINGFELGTSSSGSLNPSGTFNQLAFARGGSNNTPFYGKTKQIQVFDSALADTQLEQLTSWQSFRDMANGQLYTIE